jgi:hypothetical protein
VCVWGGGEGRPVYLMGGVSGYKPMLKQLVRGRGKGGGVHVIRCCHSYISSREQCPLRKHRGSQIWLKERE